MKETKFCNKVTRTERLLSRNNIPDDLHWADELTAKTNFGELRYLGEIYNTDQDKYYSARGGKAYRPKHKEKHLDEGHFQGYRFAIQQLTKPGDWIFDPTVGSGTAIIEAVNLGRKAMGIELEWPMLGQQNVDYQATDLYGKVIPGNAADIYKIMPHEMELAGMGDRKFNLILNGTPYPIISGSRTSDAPERKNEKGIKTVDNYTADGSFGLLKWNGAYEKFITEMYCDCVDILEEGGYLVIIIKDPTNNKKPFMLQKAIIEWVKNANPNMHDYSWFIHKHAPPTMFMSTYNKRFPDVLIPHYQVGYILQKIT